MIRFWLKTISFQVVLGLSALQYVDLRSPRNLYIVGVSLFFPLVLCQWIQKHPGVIQTGVKEIDGTLQVLLGTTILVGGALGCILDNFIPGTREERGLVAWEKEMSLEQSEGTETFVESTYDFPCGMSLLRKCKWTQYLPFLPTYKPNAKRQ